MVVDRQRGRHTTDHHTGRHTQIDTQTYTKTDTQTVVVISHECPMLLLAPMSLSLWICVPVIRSVCLSSLPALCLSYGRFLFFSFHKMIIRKIIILVSFGRREIDDGEGSIHTDGLRERERETERQRYADRHADRQTEWRKRIDK